MTNEEKLLKMKKQTDEEKSEINRLEGSQSQLYETLAKYGCKTKEGAEKKLKKLNKDLEEKENLLETGIKELENNYDWKFQK